MRTTQTNTNMELAGVVTKTLLNHMEVAFDNSFSAESVESASFKVEFSFSSAVYKKLRDGVNRAVEVLGEGFLFPSEIGVVKSPLLSVHLDDGVLKLNDTEIPWFQREIDDSQKAAVVQALRANFRPLPHIIHGPPGTGKTLTLIEIILHAFTHMKDSRILVAAHSNSAANLILERLLKYDSVKNDILRLLGMMYHEKQAILEDPEGWHEYCGILTDHQNSDVKNGIKVFQQLNSISPYRILIGTCVGLGKLMYDRDGCIPDYTHVIVDEASQCSEPEVMIPISKIDIEIGSVVLAGDPKQMPPLVLCKYAKERGLGVSLLTRLVKRYAKIEDKVFAAISFFYGFHEKTFYFIFQLNGAEREGHSDVRLISKLLYNYRSVPSVLNFYSKHFYKNELKSTVSATDSPEERILRRIQEIMPSNARRNLNHAIYFCDVVGKNQHLCDSTSWCNLRENLAVSEDNCLIMRLQ